MKKIRSTISKPLRFFFRLSLVKKILVIVVVIIILAVLNSTIFAQKQSGYVLGQVERGEISETVSETGNIYAGAITEIKSPTNGIVEEIYVSNGQTVAVGDTLIRIQSTATVQEQQAAYASYLAAQTSLNSANSMANTLRANMYGAWDRFYDMATGDEYENDGKPKEDERLAAEFQIAEDTWKAAEKQYKDQQTAIAQAQALTSSTWLAYEATQNAEVKATSKGVIANLAVTRGNNIVANTMPIMTINSDSQTQFVHVVINEIDIPKIRPGQKATIKIDAIRDEEFQGEVTRVDSIGTNTQGVITYNAYINLLVSDGRIRSGMTANVDISTETRTNALSVPNSAVKPYQGGRAVQVLVNNEPEYIPVRVGIRGRERTEILEGLNEGQEIITGARNEVVQRESGLGF